MGEEQKNKGRRERGLRKEGKWREEGKERGREKEREMGRRKGQMKERKEGKLWAGLVSWGLVGSSLPNCFQSKPLHIYTYTAHSNWAIYMSSSYSSIMQVWNYSIVPSEVWEIRGGDAVPSILFEISKWDICSEGQVPCPCTCVSKQ